MAEVRLANVTLDGEPGQLRANGEMFGFKAASGEVTHAMGDNIVAAEFLGGNLKVAIDDGRVFDFQGIRDADFDELWKLFSQSYNVHIKKHKAKKFTASAESVDAYLDELDDLADRVDDAKGVQKTASEGNLMKSVERARDMLMETIAGDKQLLASIFADNACERIGRMRLVIDTVQIGDMFKTDQRWKHLRSICKTIECVLKDLGAFKKWVAKAGEQSDSLVRRQLVLEMLKQQGALPDAEEDEVIQVAPVRKTEKSNVQMMKEQMEREAAERRRLEEEEQRRREEEEWAAQQRREEAERARCYDEEERAERLRQEAMKNAKDAEKLLAKNRHTKTEPTDLRRLRAGSEDGEPVKRDSAYEENCEWWTNGRRLKEGWVWKRSRYLRRWRRRWLVLSPDGLGTFSESGDQGRPTEGILSAHIKLVRNADAELAQPKSFMIVSKRTYYFICDTAEERDAWIAALSEKH